MSIRICLDLRRGLALAPALVLGVAAVLAQTVYAGTSSGDCFRPTLEIFSQSSGPATTTTGNASVKLKFKPPFIIEGLAKAQGFLDEDSGATGSEGAAGTSRFWTPTCAEWSYGWSATGSVVGNIAAHSGKATSGSAVGTCSFGVTASGDLAPPARDSKTAQSSTAGGGSVTMSVGGSDAGPGYSVGMTMGTTTVTPSTNAAGDVNTLFDGPKSNAGAGSETLVVVNLYAYVNAQANGSIGSWAPHVSKSSSSAGGAAGAAIEQSLYAVGGGGVGYGMVVHPESTYYRILTKSGLNAPWKESGWWAPVGSTFEKNGPDVKIVTDPPIPPDPNQRNATGGDDDDNRGPTGGPLHKK